MQGRAAPCSAGDSRVLPSSPMGAFDDEVVEKDSQRFSSRKSSACLWHLVQPGHTVCTQDLPLRELITRGSMPERGWRIGLSLGRGAISRGALPQLSLSDRTALNYIQQQCPLWPCLWPNVHAWNPVAMGHSEQSIPGHRGPLGLNTDRID